jgi:hypothetical protein
MPTALPSAYVNSKTKKTPIGMQEQDSSLEQTFKAISALIQLRSSATILEFHT